MDEFRLFPEQASTLSHQTDALFLFILSVSAFFSLLIAALIVLFAIKYRRSAGLAAHHEPQAMWLEIAWTAIPLGISMVMFGWGSKVYFNAHRPPSDAMDIHVVGKQWMWKVQHPQGRREINELHVPLGRSIRLIMISQDVIHDLYIPAFRVKQDVLPGRYTTEWFNATKAGEYHLFCAQFCGNAHAEMIGRVVVMEPSQYNDWLRGAGREETVLQAGERLYREFGCNTCHGVKAPTLAGLYGSQVKLQNGSTVAADESYLRESILYPSARVVAGYPTIMPTYKGQMSEDQLLQIIAYIKSLRESRTDVEQKP
jgi:cytochrome c oxidase subunit 2